MYHPAILPPCHICFYKARKLAGALICEATKTHFLTGVWQCRQTGVIMCGTLGAFFILLSKNVFCFSREITFHIPLFCSRWGKQEHRALWMKASSSWCTVHPGLLQKQHFWSLKKFFGRCCLHSTETEYFAFFMLGCLFSYPCTVRFFWSRKYICLFRNSTVIVYNICLLFSVSSAV